MLTSVMTCALKHTGSFGTLASPAPVWSPNSFFLEHYAPRLRKHGILVGMSSEGGEHVPQSHSKIVQKRPSRQRRKCPVRLVEIIKHVSFWLGLWMQGWLSPTLWYKNKRNFPTDN